MPSLLFQQLLLLTAQFLTSVLISVWVTKAQLGPLKVSSKGEFSPVFSLALSARARAEEWGLKFQTQMGVTSEPTLDVFGSSREGFSCLK